jgi:hypothetical protein
MKMNKFFKGLIGIFLIKIIILGTFFITQSCEESKLNNKEEIVAKRNFLNSVTLGKNNLNKIPITHSSKSFTTPSSDATKAAQEDIAYISLYSLPNITPKSRLDSKSAFTLEDLTTVDGTEIGVSYLDGSCSDNINEIQELITTYEVSVEEVKESLQPTLLEAKNYLYANGLTDTDIQYLLAADAEGPAMSESDLIPVVMQLIAEKQNLGIAASFNSISIFGTSVRASEIGACAGEAMGLPAIAVLINEGLSTSAGKALSKKTLRKVASRALGWAGAAIFVYEFGDCMEWW